MTQYGPWIQDPDFDVAGDVQHLDLPNNATDYQSSFAAGTPVDPAEFQNAWQGAEASSHFISPGLNAGTLVQVGYDGGVIPTDPTSYGGLRFFDPLFFHVTDFDRYYPDRFIPTVPPGWDGYEWEDGIGWSAIVDAVLEDILVNDTIGSLLSAATWEHQLYGTTDYVPPITDGGVPTFDLATYSRASEYVETVIGNTSGFYQRPIGHNVLHLVNDVRGSIALVSTQITASVTMTAAVEGTYQWGSFIAAIGLPDWTYLRYQMRPPRYRFFRANRTLPPRRLFPRQDGLGLGIGRSWPPPNTRQSGRGIGPGSPP